MILRRLTEHVRTQNWTAVALDFVIVVVGVFMGIQLGNWNELRKNEGLEKYYLERLRDDLERSKDLSTVNLTFAQQVPDGAARALDALQNCALPEEVKDDFASSLYRLGKLSRPVIVDTTFEEMRATGALNVFSDRALVEKLMELQRSELSSEREYSQMIAWTNDQVKEVHSRVVFEPAKESGGWTLSWEEIGIDFDVACRDQRLIAAVASLRNYALEDVRRGERGLQRISETLNAVNAALGAEPQREKASK